MNAVRIGIVAALMLCVWIAWPKGDNTPPRPLMIKSALKDARDPVVILGDDTVQRAVLPKTLCKRPVINAGIDGSTTASGLDGMLKRALGDKKAAMIVVSLGLNDAADLGTETFRSNYAALLAAVKPMTGQLAVTTITTIASDKPQAGRRRQATIDGYNTALPELAHAADARVISIPQATAGSTTDGLHLSPGTAAEWDKALRDGVETALCPNG